MVLIVRYATAEEAAGALSRSAKVSGFTGRSVGALLLAIVGDTDEADTLLEAMARAAGPGRQHE